MEEIQVIVKDLPEILADVGGLFEVLMFIGFLCTGWYLQKKYMKEEAWLCDPLKA